MPLESSNYISGLDQSNPDGLSDYVSQGDDHIRLIKKCLVQSFPGITSAVTYTSAELNDLRSNLTHSGTTFAMHSNAITGVISADDNTAVEPRSYNDSRYVRQGNVVSDDILLGNNKQLNVSQVDTTVRPAVNMSASDVLEIGGTSNITNLLGSAIQINGVNLFNLFYPIGTIYENGSVSTNPATLLGFGTWSAFGTGRVLVAIDSGATVDPTKFITIGQTGGTTTHQLSEAEMPGHTHTHAMRHVTGSMYGQTVVTVNGGGLSTLTSNVTGNGGVAGSGVAHENCQPYIVVYRWIRTA